MSTQLDVICLSPPGFPTGSLVGIQSHHPQIQGGISLEYSEPDTASNLNITKSRGGWCVAILLRDVAPFLQSVASLRERGLSRVIVCDVTLSQLKSAVGKLQQAGLEVFVQAVDIDQALEAQRCGANAVVLKGNECGGLVGEETSFILLQRVRPGVSIPIWVRGGIGVNTAAACLVGGAAGVVLDWQLALCAESNLPEDVKARISRMDGSETAILGQDCSLRYRTYTRVGEKGHQELRDVEDRLALDQTSDERVLNQWRDEVERRARGAAGVSRVLMVGQDAAFAASLARQYFGAAAIADAIRRNATRLARLAARQEALRPGGPLAAAHNTRFPILQGPMTRVSDVADFADAVATGGGLPFLALALLRGPQVDMLLEETKQKLGTKPWGVGILGFVPKELRDEQLAEVRKHPPPFAIIAGGRPDQALELEREGIATYLHVPSPGLLSMFLKSGARRVIFEGRECGGHVGPRSSFVLWESMIQVILDHLKESGDAGDQYHVVFAGGVHDACSAAMVAALSAELSHRGVRVGVLIGTAYLFTLEAVRSGAIVQGFQDEAVRCSQTILLETGVGHSTRCADTEFGKAFLDEKRKLVAEGRSKDEIREALERLNLGRLRIASKAIMRDDSFDTDKSRPTYVSLDDSGQKREGMYMIGQVASLRDKTCTIEELHTDVSAGGVAYLKKFEPVAAEANGSRRNGPSDIAIIGMSCLLPKAADKGAFWENILNGVRATGEVPADRWDSELYFTTDRRARDNCYSKWGGFLDPVAFDPTRYGMPPNSIPSVEPLQLLVLEAVRHALQDAGYVDRPFDRENTSVILGAGGGVGEHGLGYGFRSMALHYLTAAGARVDEVHTMLERLDGRIPEWTEDSFAGLLLNVAAGRVANRFDLGGTNYTVDAACASSLAAVRLAVEELESGSSNMAIVGGADTMQSPFAYLCFSNTQALSPTGMSRPFDASADGIVISEGIAIAVLKRLEDAERDGDRVYAVIKAVGSSSDGKDKGLTAPRPAGQIRALERAYAKAGFTPDTVGLIEAHGTGTVVGDQSEVESLTRSFTAAGAAPQSCALGSVKSMLGHTKCTAGVAGLLKAALALHHKVLPPTIGVTKPNPKANFDKSPFYVNTEARPWLKNGHDNPRRAGVSAFGFGGTNFHAVLEEYVGADAGAAPVECVAPGRAQWPVELFVWRETNAKEILTSVESIVSALEQGAQPTLRDLAAAMARQADSKAGGRLARLAVVAGSLDELKSRLKSVADVIRTGVESADQPGIYFAANSAVAGKVAFLFPGQGSQSVNMMRDLAIASPTVADVFGQADQTIDGCLGRALSSFVFPRPVFSDEDRAADEKALTQTRVAQPALGAADAAMLNLVGSLGLKADMVGGHSYGEYVALYAAGAISFEDLMRLSEARGLAMGDAGAAAGGAMAAISADEKTVASIIAGIDGVWCANFNAPTQTVITGTENGVAKALEACKAKNVAGRKINVSCAFHSPLMASATATFEKALRGASWNTPRVPVYSNTSAAAHRSDGAAIQKQLLEHLVKPVRFTEQIEAMHAAGARGFVEVGPGRVLTGLVEQTLKGKPFRAVALAGNAKESIASLMQGLGQLWALGLEFSALPLTESRTTRAIDISKLVEQTRPAPLSPMTWMVSGAKSVPLAEASEGAAATTAPTKPAQQTHGTSRTSPPQNTVVHATQSQSVSSNTKRVATPSPSRQPIEHQPAQLPNAAPTGRAGSVMAAHQQLMSRFLDTHKSVMLSLLGQGPQAGHGGALAQQSGPVVAARDVSASTVPTVAEPIVGVAGHPISVKPAPAVGATQAASPAPSTSAETNGHIAPATLAVDRREKLTEALVGIVADRTGYPKDMLGLDMDLEADLGIDSIKRVEILGALQEGTAGGGQAASGDMETLSKVKTLRGIVDWLCARMPGGDPSTATSSPKSEAQYRNASAYGSPDSAASEAKLLPRMILQEAGHPLHRSRSLASFKGGFIIINDEQGIAPLVAESLKKAGLPSDIAHVDRGAEHNGSQPRIDLTDPRVTKEWCEQFRARHGVIAGVIHLLPMANVELHRHPDSARWIEPLNTEVHSLFNVVQAVEKDLRENGGTVLAITQLDGAFGSLDPKKGAFWPGSGATCGLAKSLAREWSEVVSRIVDVGPGQSAQQIADIVLNELQSDDRSGEVGYRHGKRIALLPVEASLTGRNPSVELSRESVVLITGGARGVTAEAAVELAQRYSCRLVLVGRAAHPAATENPATAGVTDTKQLKTALLAGLEKSGEKVTPAKVEAAYARLMRERETRTNLAAMRDAGATVEYHAVDVASETEFGAVIDRIYQQHGRIDGVIHGAGVIEDKLIRDKTLESFRRVCDPKIRGAFTLMAKLRPESLKFLAFFSSVSGRYGNRGQSDYAAANEVLDKLALYLNAKWKARVTAMIWGPWESTGGMVSAELAKQFAKAGIHIISRREGKKAVIDEIVLGRKDEAEVVFGGPLDVTLPKAGGPGAQTIQATSDTPLLNLNTQISRRADGGIEIIREVDPASDIYLSDHQLDGRPVMPMAMMQEFFAEACSLVRPGWNVTRIRDLRVLRGISFEKGPRSIRVTAMPPTDDGSIARIKVQAEVGELGQIHDTSEVEISRQALTPANHQPLKLVNPRPLPLTVADAYEQWLFHGPIFAGIVEVEAVGDNGVIAQIAPSTPRRCLVGSPPGEWLIDPVMVDSALQLIILWARVHLDMTPLPARLTAYHRYEGPIREPVRCEATVRHTAGTPIIHADFKFLDARGVLVGWLEGLEGTCSKALNRLAETRSGQVIEQK